MIITNYDSFYTPIPDANVQILIDRVQTALSARGRVHDNLRTGCHSSYIFETEDGKVYNIRVIWPVMSGSRGVVVDYKMVSEVATIEFLRMKSTIPIPQVVHHDRDVDHGVGGEWSIVEYVHNSQSMSTIWPSLASPERRELVLQVADLWAEIINFKFDAIGSLHTDPLSPHGVVVGPMSFLAFINEEAMLPRNPGPFHSIRDFLFATIALDTQFLVPGTEQHPEHPKWQAEARALVDELFPAADCPWSRRLGSALVLNHIDFSSHNILVSKDRPIRVLAVIDWEGANIVPAWAVRPHWRWPSEATKEEIDLYTPLMRERVEARCPAWKEAMSDEFEKVRVMWANAVMADAEPQNRGIGKRRVNFLMPEGEL